MPEATEPILGGVKGGKEYCVLISKGMTFPSLFKLNGLFSGPELGEAYLVSNPLREKLPVQIQGALSGAGLIRAGLEIADLGLSASLSRQRASNRVALVSQQSMGERELPGVDQKVQVGGASGAWVSVEELRKDRPFQN